jgi:hypothetical protein
VQGGEAGAIQAIPGRLDALKWPLIGGFCVLFVLAAIFLVRKPVAMVVPQQELQAATPRIGQTSVSPEKKPAGTSTNGDALASLDHATATSLEALKDQLFRLELRRQAGTISEEEYARERAKAEHVLRELVRG